MVLLAFILNAQTSDTVTIKQLNWLSGYWTAESGGIKMEEFWLPESNGLLVGLHRDSFGSDKTFFEFLRIEQLNDTIIYQASPRGKEPTPFYLKSMDTHIVVFENIKHEYPQRIIYSLKTDTLIARIEAKLKMISNSVSGIG
jgi:hypothetical protein